MPAQRAMRRMRDYFWICVGVLALALGLLGIPLPLLPTTPFLILAAFAFGKSAPQWRARLVEHPTFGPPIRDWQANGAIALRYKIMACGFMATTFIGSVLVGVPTMALVFQAIFMGGAAVFVLTRPNA